MHGSDDVDLREGLVLPGFVDTHVHFPQVRAIGGLGMPLLDWLEKCALPEEARLADASYAASVASDFVSGLVRAGTTTALVFGSHFASAVDALFTEATRVGLRVTSGLVLSDRILREDLFTTPERAYDEGLELAKRWHGQGRTRYAVTPRFSLSCSDALLESAGSLLADGPELWFTSHLNENVEEIEGVRQLFGCDYTTSYERSGLLGPRSVLAHNVHPSLQELMMLARHGAAVAHCPTSNAALGSGLFPLGSHLALGVRVALGSDVGAGTGFSLFKEGLQAYFAQQLLGREGHRLSSRHLLHLATAAGADVLGLSDTIGDFSVGKEFDALWLRPRRTPRSTAALRHADGYDDALAKAFALASPADVAATWVAGERAVGWASRRRAASRMSGTARRWIGPTTDQTARPGRCRYVTRVVTRAADSSDSKTSRPMRCQDSAPSTRRRSVFSRMCQPATLSGASKDRAAAAAAGARPAAWRRRSGRALLERRPRPRLGRVERVARDGEGVGVVGLGERDGGGHAPAQHQRSAARVRPWSDLWRRAAVTRVSSPVASRSSIAPRTRARARVRSARPALVRRTAGGWALASTSSQSSTRLTGVARPTGRPGRPATVRTPPAREPAAAGARERPATPTALRSRPRGRPRCPGSLRARPAGRGRAARGPGRPWTRTGRAALAGCSRSPAPAAAVTGRRGRARARTRTPSPKAPRA